MKALAILAFLFSLVSCQKKTDEKKAPIFQVEACKPTVKDVTLYKTYVGNVQPFVQVEVKAQVEGELLGSYFIEGQAIQAGDLLFKIDSRPYEAQLLKAEGALAQSLANLRYAQDVAYRNTPLAKEEFVSEVQYDQYLTNVLTYQAQIKENEADIETAKIKISYCNIHSPIDAVTGRLQIQVGNLIENAGATPLVTLNQITPTYAYFSVPQKDLPEIMKLHREKPLEVGAILESDSTKLYRGNLDLIDNQVDDQTGSIWLRGIFPNQEQMLWPGEFVQVRLYTRSVENALLIPTEAISIGQKGKYVFVINSQSEAELRFVQTGQRMGNLTYIEKGIKPDDLVVTKGQINLGNGTQVKLKGEKSTS